MKRVLQSIKMYKSVTHPYNNYIELVNETIRRLYFGVISQNNVRNMKLRIDLVKTMYIIILFAYRLRN